MNIWYKVRHPWFDKNTAYLLVQFTFFSETGWDYLTFVLPTGHTVSVQNHRCTALPYRPKGTPCATGGYSRPLIESEIAMPYAGKLPCANPEQVHLEMT